MAQLFDIRKVTIGPSNLVAEVEVAPNAPLMTSDDPQGTELVAELIPELGDHLCLGDSSSSFGDVIASTELAHLLEHVTVELLARTDLAGDVSSGRTVGVGERLYEITLACPDDVLVAGALSSAVWILQWAYSGGGDPRPDVDAIASGLVSLVGSLSEADDAAAPEPVEASAQEAAPEPEEPEGDPAPAVGEEEPAPAEDDAGRPARDAWDLGDVPRPHLVR